MLVSYGDDLSLEYFDESTLQVELSAQHVALIYLVATNLNSSNYWLDWDTNRDAIQAMLADLIALIDGTPVAAEGITEITITPATVFPVLLKSVAAGETVDEVLLVVDMAFDTGSLTIGDAGDVDRLMLATDNSLLLAEQFQVSPEYQYPAAADVYVYLTGTPSVGSARIRLYSYPEA